MKTDGPQRSLREGSDLSWKEPGVQKAHPLHRGQGSLQEAALQRASLGLDGQGCGELSLWARLSHQGPTDRPCRNTDSGALSQPLTPRQAGLKAGATLSKSETHQVHCKPLQSAQAPPPAGLPSGKHAFRSAAGPGVTAHTRHTLSRLPCGRPSRQSLIFKERLTMYYS